MDDPIYYRIQIPTPRHRYMDICTLQSFDEYDYDESKWLSDDDGPLKFDTEGEAKEYLRVNVAVEYVNPNDMGSHVNRWKK